MILYPIILLTKAFAVAMSLSGRSEVPTPIIGTTIAFIALCCFLDVRTRRVPNLLSGPAMLVGIALNTMYFGIPGLTASLLGILLTITFLLLPFALGGIGGGDVKMIGAIGALLG